MDEQYAFAQKMIEDNRDAMIRIAEALLEHETLDAKQVYDLIEGKELAPRVPVVPPQETPSAPVEAVESEEANPDTDTGGMKPSLA